VTPYLYPEDFGAVGNGVADDWNAIQQAITACAPWESVLLAGQYAISHPIQPGSRSVQSSATSTLMALPGCATAFDFTQGDTFHRLPSLSRFTGSAIVLAGGVMNIDVQKIQNCGAAIELNGGAINNTVDVQWVAGCGTFVKVTNPNGPAVVIQGNTISTNFAVGCVNGLTFDGSDACDSNTVNIGSWDSLSIKGACIWLNTGAVPLSTWTLNVQNWLGGLLSAPDGLIAKGAFQFCSFGLNNFATFPANWDALQIALGGGNEYRCSSTTGYANSFVANWMDAPNKRATFGNAAYLNTRLCKGAFGPHAVGDLVFTYVYTPFADGNSFSYRVQPIFNPGVELFEIKDNSATVKGEVCVKWRVVKEWTGIAEFDFQFTAGVP